VPSAIIVARPGEAVSFETTAKHFPIYLKDSSLNTNPNFDDGVFDTLKTKLISSRMKIASLAYTFGEEGVYVFGDYADPANSQTIVVISKVLHPAIMPPTAENLAKLGVAPVDPDMQVLPVSLAFIGPVFIALSAASLLAQSILELRIQKKEVKRVGRQVAMRKEHDMLLKKESILAYLDDLLSLVRSNLDEVKAKVREGGDKKRLKELLDAKLSAMNDLKPSSKEDLQVILDESKKLLENLRFADGRSLKEALQERLAEKALQQGLSNEAQEEAGEDSYGSEGEDDYYAEEAEEEEDQDDLEDEMQEE